MKNKKSQSESRWLILALACFILFGTFYSMDNPSALYNQMKEIYTGSENKNAISSQSFEYQFNLMYSLYSLPNIALPLVGGLLTSQFKNRTLLLFLSLIVCVGALIVSFGAFQLSLGIMLIGRLIFGMGSETLQVAQSTLMSTWFLGGELSLAFGLNLSTARFGSVMNDILSPSLSSSHSLQFAFFISFILCGISSLLAWLLWFFDKKYDQQNEQGELQNLQQNVSYNNIWKFSTKFWLVIIVLICIYMTILPFNNIAAGFISSTYYNNLSTENSAKLAGKLISIPFLMSALFTPLLGYLLDSWGERTKFISISIICVLAAHCGFLVSYTNYFYIAPWWNLMLLGWGYSIFVASIWPCIVYSIQDSNQLGLAFGVATSLQNLFLFATPIVIAYLQNTFSYQAIFIMFISFCLLGLFFTWILHLVDIKQGGKLSMSNAEINGCSNKKEDEIEFSTTYDSI